MKKPEILIGDFIRFNTPSLNNMTTQSPEIAAAFAIVMKELAVKYGNISLPGATTTTAVIDEAKLLELTKDDIANGIMGDIVRLDDTTEMYFVITDVKFTDTFNNTFDVEVTLKPFTRNLKNKNKGIVTPLKDYYNYFTNPYGFGRLKPTQAYIIDYKYTCLTDLLTSMPLFKFKKGNENAKEYVFIMDVRAKTKNPNAGYYDKSYWFVNVNTQENLYLDCDAVIKMFFNEEINKDNLVCNTFLLPLLYQKQVYQPKATDILGIKVIPHTNIIGNTNANDFYTIDKLILNKPKNKVYELIEYDSLGGSKRRTTYTITPNDVEDLFRQFYTGICKNFEWFVESPYEKTTSTEFVEKFRTYCKEDYENIFGYFDLRNYLTTIPIIFNNEATKYDEKTNLDISNEVFKGFQESMYIKELLETKITFGYNYIQEKDIASRIYYFVSHTNNYNYKDKGIDFEFSTGSRQRFLEMFTVLPQSPKIGSYRSAYQQPKIHLANIPLAPGSAMMYVKNAPINSNVLSYVFQRVFEYSSVRLLEKQLDFTYTEQGKTPISSQKEVFTISFDSFIEYLKLSGINILEKDAYKKVFNNEIGEIRFNIGESYLFSEDDTIPAKYNEIIDRYVVPNSTTNYTGRLQLKLKEPIVLNSTQNIWEFSNLFNYLNPYNLQIGDKVYIGEGYYVNQKLKEEIKNANQDYYEIIKRKYSTIKPTISVNQSYYDNKDFGDIYYFYMLMPYDQLTNVVQPIQETFGLKIGDNLPADVISSWGKGNNNYYAATPIGKWVEGKSSDFFGDRTIQGFEMLDGQLGFLISGTANVYLKAEGFKEFLEAQTQKNIKPTKSGIITSESLPGLEIWGAELGVNTQQEALDKMEMMSDDWRFPTRIEMALIAKDPKIRKQYDRYWVSEPETVYLTVKDETVKVLSNFEKWHYFMVKGSFKPNTQTTTSTTNDEIQVGDIVEWYETIPNYSAKKGARALVDSITEEFYFVEWLDNLANGAVNGGYMKEDFVKSDNQTLPSSNSTKKVTQTIETIPSEMSVYLAMDSNTGNRNSPTQSAGDLKSIIKDTEYETEVLNAYYMGNDGDWYKLNVEKSGIWKWKKADPQPTQNATTTLNKDYASMTQNELKQRISDLKVAMTVFDEEDDEYKDFETELDLIELYVEN
jgi:hypothetical protein